MGAGCFALRSWGHGAAPKSGLVSGYITGTLVKAKCSCAILCPLPCEVPCSRRRFNDDRAWLIHSWPLEWTEIIIIFVPIFLPMLKHLGIDPILWGTLVFVNLQAAFLSPPVAMSAFYLKGVAPKHVTLNQIFAGMMPYMLIVIVCMVIMYLWPGMTLWLPRYLYGG
jgi:hypothetical protein